MLEKFLLIFSTKGDVFSLIVNTVIGMRLFFFVIFFLGCLIWVIRFRAEHNFSQKYNSVDAVIAAFNEELGIKNTIVDLICNKYINKIICVNDGSTDNTGRILDALKKEYPNKLTVVHQINGGKANALNAGITLAEADMVFLTDADIRIPNNNNGLGYMIAFIEKGYVAVNGVSASNLRGAGIIPRIRASVKSFGITFRRTAMQIIGGSPFCISGACGLYKTEILKQIPIPENTQVEDLDYTWELIERGYKVAQSAKCIVFSQECNKIMDEIRRWKRWIIGYAVCMRLHPKLVLKKRFGLTVILPMMFLGLTGIFPFIGPAISSPEGLIYGWGIWIAILLVTSSYCAIVVQKKIHLLFFAPLSALIVLMTSILWIFWGIPALITGKESSKRDKPTRYST